ncbi:hypothetical protein A2276_02090 [candidate division WOR-1 bacterium RIFOXYA12_FULL_43_27]|uniref:Uncharacterized protein n=1 Tax=candidate division WOR-1 bacterium RIFOXYC2_FULL_46_14 TaxID=1802587 RepID=A0A1F4U6G8_UNCSA|nr:MAG: hypothetical protein A2276_02090 [candidate division WOR-1 bacterium RIFOXYA12_FULL_43_27]OGC19488.1 MAG: hypothetical protein A2292_02240 [candidate division WOR-1 bacterium RIFOXYB2_FULL_46_45]OGC30476.1 MAG: hypothetical protein A2232_02240 [candidate division WOR-1 bacterium RIFOXYA2_FULL_46_56]OGC40544.1 MAG: hypothetical protein A2438_05955 [candidate division WOR-1 bacterium RIFOXYC2_FULL_46_14]
MVILAIVILLFLLGFGFYLFSHANREIHLSSKRVGMFISVFIIFFASVLTLYLTGYLFSRTLFAGERPFEVGMGPLKTWFASLESGTQKDEALEECLINLNTALRQQALSSILTVKAATPESEAVEIKQAAPVAPKALKKQVNKPKKRTSLAFKTYQKPTVSSPKTINDLVGFDPDNYSDQNEPVLRVVPLTND